MDGLMQDELKKPEKNQLIQRILKIELGMFLSVPTAQLSRCQESPEGFILTRGSVFETWSDEALSAYLEDLTEAVRVGRNLMSEKYARMDNLIPCLNLNPTIDDVMKIEAEWQEDLRQKHPELFSSTPATGICTAEFDVYLRSELETYSNKTIASYFRNVLSAKARGINLTKEKYIRIFQKLGNSHPEIPLEFRLPS